MGNLTSQVGQFAADAILPGISLIEDIAERKFEKRVLKKEQQQDLRQLTERQRAEELRAEQDAALDRAELAAKEDDANRERLIKLRAAQGAARARLGSSGITATDGSGEAIIEGLFDQNDEAAAFETQINALKRTAIDTDLEQVKSQNLLERQQLKDRQAFERSLL